MTKSLLEIINTVIWTGTFPECLKNPWWYQSPKKG
jgi:hypothetical protein